MTATRTDRSLRSNHDAQRFGGLTGWCPIDLTGQNSFGLAYCRVQRWLGRYRSAIPAHIGAVTGKYGLTRNDTSDTEFYPHWLAALQLAPLSLSHRFHSRRRRLKFSQFSPDRKAACLARFDCTASVDYWHKQAQHTCLRFMFPRTSFTFKNSSRPSLTRRYTTTFSWSRVSSMLTLCGNR